MLGRDANANQKEVTAESNQDPFNRLQERIKQLEAELLAKTKQIKTLEDDLKWNRSDFENYRKSIEKRLDSEKQNILAKLLKDFLPFFDAFDKGMESARALLANPGLAEPVKKFLGGLESLQKNLNGILEARKIKRMEVLGKPFDYNYHEVMMQVEDENLVEDTIIHEVQRGWLIDGKVLRPAMVNVSKKPAKPEAEPPDQEQLDAGTDATGQQ